MKVLPADCKNESHRSLKARIAHVKRELAILALVLDALNTTMDEMDQREETEPFKDKITSQFEKTILKPVSKSLNFEKQIYTCLEIKHKTPFKDLFLQSFDSMNSTTHCKYESCEPNNKNADLRLLDEIIQLGLGEKSVPPLSEVYFSQYHASMSVETPKSSAELVVKKATLNDIHPQPSSVTQDCGCSVTTVVKEDSGPSVECNNVIASTSSTKDHHLSCIDARSCAIVIDTTEDESETNVANKVVIQNSVNKTDKLCGGNCKHIESIEKTKLSINDSVCTKSVNGIINQESLLYAMCYTDSGISNVEEHFSKIKKGKTKHSDSSSSIIKEKSVKETKPYYLDNEQWFAYLNRKSSGSSHLDSVVCSVATFDVDKKSPRNHRRDQNKHAWRGLSEHNENSEENTETKNRGIFGIRGKGYRERKKLRRFKAEVKEEQNNRGRRKKRRNSSRFKKCFRCLCCGLTSKSFCWSGKSYRERKRRRQEAASENKTTTVQNVEQKHKKRRKRYSAERNSNVEKKNKKNSKRYSAEKISSSPSAAKRRVQSKTSRAKKNKSSKVSFNKTEPSQSSHVKKITRTNVTPDSNVTSNTSPSLSQPAYGMTSSSQVSKKVVVVSEPSAVVTTERSQPPGCGDACFGVCCHCKTKHITCDHVQIEQTSTCGCKKIETVDCATNTDIFTFNNEHYNKVMFDDVQPDKCGSKIQKESIETKTLYKRQRDVQTPPDTKTFVDEKLEDNDVIEIDKPKYSRRNMKTVPSKSKVVEKETEVNEIEKESVKSSSLIKNNFKKFESQRIIKESVSEIEQQNDPKQPYLTWEDIKKMYNINDGKGRPIRRRSKANFLKPKRRVLVVKRSVSSEATNVPEKENQVTGKDKSLNLSSELQEPGFAKHTNCGRGKCQVRRNKGIEDTLFFETFEKFGEGDGPDRIQKVLHVHPIPEPRETTVILNQMSYEYTDPDRHVHFVSDEVKPEKVVDIREGSSTCGSLLKQCFCYCCM